jgi:hypothetical protein
MVERVYAYYTRPPLPPACCCLSSSSRLTGVCLSQTTGIAAKVDNSSATVGRRYARADEIGIPFGITVDFGTIRDDAVTLRERDSTVGTLAWLVGGGCNRDHGCQSASSS